MDAYTIPADRLVRMDPTTRAVLALITTGITGGALREADRDPLDIYDALEAVDALHSAGVPPIAVGDDGLPTDIWGPARAATVE